MDNINTPNTVPQEGVDASGGDTARTDSKSKAVSSSTPEPKEEKLFAGKYKTPEDLEHGYKELETKLGSLGTKAALADKLIEKISQEQNIDKETALEYLNTLSRAETTELVNEVKREEPEGLQELQGLQKITTPVSEGYYDPIARAKLSVLERKIQRQELKENYPDLDRKVIEAVEKYAMSVGKSLLAAYEEDFAPMIESGKKEAYSKQKVKEEIKVTTSQGEPPPEDKRKKVIDKLRAARDNDDQKTAALKDYFFGK